MRCALLIVGIVLLTVFTSAQEAPTGDQVAAWRESLELDLPGEVLRDGPRLVTGTGALHADGEALALVARAMYATGKEALAKSLLSDARPTLESAYHVELERAHVALLEDDLAQVVKLLRTQDGVRFADSPECWLLVGRALARAGARGEAAPYLQTFLERAPLSVEAPAAWYMLAQIAVQTGDAAGAKTLSDRAAAAARWQTYYRARRLQVRETPEAPLPRLGLAQLWMEVEAFERARRELEVLVARSPNFVRGWSHLGEACRRMGDAQVAKAAFDRTLELDPKDTFARHSRGLLALDEERLDDARTDFEALTRRTETEDRRVVDAHLQLARLELRAGDDSGAQELFERYRALGGKEEL